MVKILQLLLVPAVCISLCCITANNAYGGDPYAYWLMPGFNYQLSPKTYLFGQLGWNPEQRLFLAYGNYIIRHRPNLDFNLGSMYIDVQSREVKEWTLMNGITLRIPAGNFLIENRSLVWNRFKWHEEDQHFFRNRVRFMRPFKNAWQVTPYLFDEASYSFNEGNIARNRLGAGCAVTIEKRVLVDVFYARQNDKVSGKLNLFFVMVTAQFPRKSSQ